MMWENFTEALYTVFQLKTMLLKRNWPTDEFLSFPTAPTQA